MTIDVYITIDNRDRTLSPEMWGDFYWDVSALLADADVFRTLTGSAYCWKLTVELDSRQRLRSQLKTLATTYGKEIIWSSALTLTLKPESDGREQSDPEPGGSPVHQ